jgi:cellulose synthase/poly-beta-1,6-N-acetylglucosamine synthase-like glycosyltransferase
MTITVLVCAHSTNNFYDNLLIDSLKSLERQTYKDFKTLIVLDQCWYKTENRIKNEITIECDIITKELKEGLSFAKNYGLSKIDTDLVCFLDADDLYVEDKLEKQINYFNNNDVDFLGTHALNRDLGSNNFFDSCFGVDQYIEHDEIKFAIFNENVLTHGSMMIKKQALEQLNGYNNIKGMEDWDLWKRAFNNGFKFKQLPERLYVYTLNTSIAR